MGNPEVAANFVIDECPTPDLVIGPLDEGERFEMHRNRLRGRRVREQSGSLWKARSVLLASLSLGLVYAVPASAITLSKKEWKAFSCVLSKARDQGNPDVAAGYAIDECPTEGLSDAQKERIRDLVTRRLMKEYGLTCIGTGCGGGE
ncbi:hypothetical protein X754_28635 [Mesorhizobium sp. LNJC403B00]|nr:hypothetical protein X754_28635 [Mesorhizobium sp. LNJC403B00]